MLLNIIITFVLVFMNGFFVAAEFAIVKVRTSKLEIKAQDGNRFAILAKHMVNNLDAYLAATQLGITLASLGLGWIGEPVVSKLIISFMEMLGIHLQAGLAEKIALPFAFIIITILHIVFGELAPKSLAIQRSEQTTLVIAYPLKFFYFIFKPFIWILNGIAIFILRLIGLNQASESEIYSNEELKLLVEQVKENQEGEEDARYEIIKNAFDFSDRTVKQIMVPRTQVVAIDVNDYDATTINNIVEDGFSRIPCYEDNIDNIVGFVNLKDILLKMRKNGTVNVKSILRPVSFVPETKRIGRLLKEFQIKHQQIAMVVDEYGGIEGIITMEDILEELVGEIQDEYDNEIPFVEKTGEDTYSVIATAALSDINDHLPHQIDKEKQYDTLAGYLIDKFGRVPNLYEKIESDDYTFSVLKKNKTSIMLVQLHDLRYIRQEENNDLEG